jgi:hypothetical protein
MSPNDDACLASSERLAAGVARDPDFLNKPYEESEANSAPKETVMILWNDMSDYAMKARKADSALTP